jgi:acetyl-CoA carboxylase biotin carboxyl carrier protein
MSAYFVAAGTQGTVLTIAVSLGNVIASAQIVARIEIMKMEVPIESPVAGRVTQIHVAPGDIVAEETVLMTIETSERAPP